jgi:hypothetical protein
LVGCDGPCQLFGGKTSILENDDDEDLFGNAVEPFKDRTIGEKPLVWTKGERVSLPSAVYVGIVPKDIIEKVCFMSYVISSF